MGKPITTNVMEERTDVARPPVRYRRMERPLWRDYAEASVIALVIVFVLRTFVVQAYRIPSQSMEDTLLAGDFVLVNKVAYHFGEPKPGQVIVFKYPLNPDKSYVKRVVALPGQTVAIRNKVLFIDGKPAPSYPGVKHTDSKILPPDFSSRDNFGPIQVPPDNLFVLGDNRDDSQDSRVWGFVPKANLIGKAMFVYWSWKPDPKAPKWESPYITPLFAIFFYNLTHFPSRMRWDRLGQVVR